MLFFRSFVVLAFVLSVSSIHPTVVRASDDKPPATAKKPSTKSPGNSSKKTEKPTSFTGEVVKVAAGAGTDGKIFVKHANGSIDEFEVPASTKISGAASLKAITKGSMVVVESIKKHAVAINVSKLAAPNAPDKVQGAPVRGTVVKVHADAYGDTGHLAVKTSAGGVKEFQVTNSTIVRHPQHKDFVHSLQFLRVGDSVTVEHDSGKIALRVDVTATVGN